MNMNKKSIGLMLGQSPNCIVLFYVVVFHIALSLSNVALAEGNSRLLTTGGVTGFEGSAGGGITPWAFIAGYGTEDEIQTIANIQLLDVGHYQLKTFGISAGIYDQFELSYQKQYLSVSSGVISSTFDLLTQGAISNAPGTQIAQDILGAKYKLFGDAVFSTSPWQPQIAVGMQYKVNRDMDTSLRLPDGSVPLPNQGVPRILGAVEDRGIDFYITATQYLIGAANGNNLLLNLTARATKANTFGLLGFESEGDDSYKLEWEGTLAVATSPSTVFGVEFRTQSDRLGGLAKEQTVKDVFVAWFPNKSLSITAAWVGLGNLPFEPDAKSFYLSVTSNF